MADYIYLIQNRLTPAQWRALEAVREAARAHGMPVFLVGGAVRDLTSGTPVRDLDFAVQGDTRALIGDLEARGAVVAGENSALSSTYLTFRGGVRVEVGPTLTVTYPKPGQPETESAGILDDLRRRDFTANAMAVSLNEGSYGLLLDPLNGTADIENRELRLVSPYGFIEQPSLLLRAARLSERLGWSLEERTASRYTNSKEEGHIQSIAAADRGYELEEIFHEEDPVAILEHMEAEGWREALFPALRAADADRGSLDATRDLMGQLEGQGIHPDPSAVYFPAVTAKMSGHDRSALKAAFARQGFVRQIESLEARAKELGTQLTSKAAAQPSAAWHLLMDADPEVVLYLAQHSRGGAVQTKIKAFLKDWPQMRQKIPYALMQEMRITPDLPGYDKLLDDLFFALIDGKLDTPEATRAFLEPFSPPAPPQLPVRRRPAKASRGRAKKMAEEVVAEPAEDTEDDESGDADSDAETPEIRVQGSLDDIDDDAALGGDEDEGAGENQDEPETTEESATPKPPAAAEPTPPLTVATKAPGKVAGTSSAKPSKAAAKAPPAKKSAEPAHGKAAVKVTVKTAHAHAQPSKKGAGKPATKPAPVKVVAGKATAKRVPAKAPAKAAVKQAAKVAPAKALKKAPAKKQAVKAKSAAPAKKAPPAKAPVVAKGSKTAKKAAKKTSGRR